MKLNQSLLASALISIVVLAPAVAGNGPGANAGAFCEACISLEVDATEAATLGFMREEEKLARDLYLQFYALWQWPLFDNIAASEQRHMDAVKRMLDKYGLPDPAVGDLPGWFSDPELQPLYDDLLLRGSASYEEALRAGALVEEVDIEDNQNAIDATDNPDLQQMYGNLLRGSRNHLRAFVGELERQGLVYEAQYLAPDTLDGIVDSPMERGGARRQGRARNGR